MADKNLLLLSNSTLPGDPYFSWPLPFVKEFAQNNGIKRVAFVPYAAITFSFEKYTEILQKAIEPLGIEVINVDAHPNAIQEADAIAVGGGNTFALLKRSYEKGLVEPIRNAVANGKPYMGWSAGSNMACPTLCTTNDMPIVQPPTFEALNLIPFQINPHYTEKTIANHGGESRDTRLTEYIEINPGKYVAAIPEGSLIEIQGDKVLYKGVGNLKTFRKGDAPKLYTTTDDLSFLLR